MRYGVLDWAPVYLSEEKHFDLKHQVGHTSYTNGLEFLVHYYVVTFLINYSKGRRGPAGFFFMLGVTVFVLIYWLNPPGNAWLGNVSLICHWFLNIWTSYVSGLQALDYVPKKQLAQQLD